MSLEDRALKLLRALIKETQPEGGLAKKGRELRERAGRAGVRIMDEVVSMIAQRRIRTHARKPWEQPEQLTATQAEARPADREPAPRRSVPATPAHESRGAQSRHDTHETGAGRASEVRAPAEAPGRSTTPSRDPAASASRRPQAVDSLLARAESMRAKAEQVVPVPEPVASEPIAPAPAEPDDDAVAELPRSYGVERLVFLARDPEWGHAYWEIDLARIHHALTVLNGGHAYLRLLDAHDGTLLHEADTWAERGRYNLRFPEPDRAYAVELVIRGGDGRSITLARSNLVEAPPAAPRPPGELRFLDLTAQRAVLARARDLSHPPRLELAHAVPMPAPRDRRRGFEVSAADRPAPLGDHAAAPSAPERTPAFEPAPARGGSSEAWAPRPRA